MWALRSRGARPRPGVPRGRRAEARASAWAFPEAGCLAWPLPEAGPRFCRQVGRAPRVRSVASPPGPAAGLPESPVPRLAGRGRSSPAGLQLPPGAARVGWPERRVARAGKLGLGVWPPLVPDLRVSPPRGPLEAVGAARPGVAGHAGELCRGVRLVPLKGFAFVWTLFGIFLRFSLAPAATLQVAALSDFQPGLLGSELQSRAGGSLGLHPESQDA